MITFVVYVLCTSNTAKPGITETRLIQTVLTFIFKFIPVITGTPFIRPISMAPSKSV